MSGHENELHTDVAEHYNTAGPPPSLVSGSPTTDDATQLKVGRAKKKMKRGAVINVFSALVVAVLVGVVAFALWWAFGEGKGVEDPYEDADGNTLGVFRSADLGPELFQKNCKTISPTSQVCSTGHNLEMTEPIQEGMTCALVQRTLPRMHGDVKIYCCGKTRADVQMALKDVEVQPGYLSYRWSSQNNFPPEGYEWTHCYSAHMCGGADGSYRNCANVECQRKGFSKAIGESGCNSHGEGQVYSMKCGR